jgi:hypothetical protein
MTRILLRAKIDAQRNDPDARFAGVQREESKAVSQSHRIVLILACVSLALAGRRYLIVEAMSEWPMRL